MYRSRHDPETPLTGSTFGCKGTTRLIGAAVPTKKDGALFGPPGSLDKPDPKNFLKKTSSTKGDTSDFKSQFKYSDRLKPPIPSKDETPLMGLRSSKNYVTANAVEAILQGEISVPV